MNKKLQYPEGSFIKWCDEYYKVIRNTSDYHGVVSDMGGDNLGFYFEYGGEKAQLVTDENEIKELQNLLKS